MSNVIIVGDFLPLSGVTTFIDNVFLGDSSDNQYFALNVSGDPTTKERYIAAGWKYQTIAPANKRFFNHLKDWHGFLKHNAKNYDIIYFNYSAMWNFIPILMAKMFFKKTVIVHAHNTYFGTKAEGIKLEILTILHHIGQWVTSSGVIDSRVAVSEEAAKWVFGKKAEQARIVPNGIDLALFEYSDSNRNQFRDNSDESVVYATIGVLEPRKNIKFAIDVFHQIHQLQPTSRLWIIGDGSESSMLRQLVHDSGLDDCVKFWGRVDDMTSLYSAVDILLFPSKYEGLSMTVIEAQTAGVLVYTSTTIPLGKVIRGLVRPLDVSDGPAAWATQIVQQGLPNSRDVEPVMRSLGYDKSQMKSEILKLISEAQ